MIPKSWWVAWVGVGLILETVALVNGIRGDTLTEVILGSVPGWLIYMALGWLVWHFRNAR